MKRGKVFSGMAPVRDCVICWYQLSLQISNSFIIRNIGKNLKHGGYGAAEMYKDDGKGTITNFD